MSESTMFTGLIQAIGKISAIEKSGSDQRIEIYSDKLDFANVDIGHSIAVNGVCLTVTGLHDHRFSVDVSGETLSCTTLGERGIGHEVNLEQSLTPSSRLGGHFVSGHVDGVGSIEARCEEGRSIRFTVLAPGSLARYIAGKGSICVDGVSLTVNHVSGQKFDVNIIPHTIQETIIKYYKPGTRVNLEVDLIARYLERLLLGERAAENTHAGGITWEFLSSHGYLKRD
jgi:riboflavin synthase